MYLICNLLPVTHLDVGHHGFFIELPPLWPRLVAQAAITQEMVDAKLVAHAEQWLDACGYDRKTDDKPPRRLYPAHSIRVRWGEWGPEFIQVPGDACTLGINRGGLSLIPKARTLEPHNIDSWKQKQLLLLVFTILAEDVVCFSRDLLRRLGDCDVDEYLGD